MKPPSFDGLTGASKLSDRKGKESSDGQEGGGTSAPSRGGHNMAKEASVLEELVKSIQNLHQTIYIHGVKFVFLRKCLLFLKYYYSKVINLQKKIVGILLL